MKNTRQNSVRLVLLALAALVGLAALGCSTTCESGAVCGNNNQYAGPSTVLAPSPAPSPSPAPGATPDPCRIDAVLVAFHSGAQFPHLALGTVYQLDATPVNSGGEVPKGCNVARVPLWQVLTPSTCQITGNGFNPFVQGIRVGLCSLTVNVSNVVSAPFAVDVR